MTAPRDDYGTPGLCECGCGRTTSLATRNKPSRGHVIGEPMRFVVGHATRKNPLDLVVRGPGCWEWAGNHDAKGYGRAFLPGQRSTTAHRRIYELLVGPIPEGFQVDHLCRNRGCVNPAHLEAVTQSENIFRAYEATMGAAAHGTERKWRRGCRCLLCLQAWMPKWKRSRG